MNAIPFHEDLKVVDVQLSNKSFVSAIESDLKNTNFILTTLDRCIYPSNKTFAELSSRVYDDYKNFGQPLTQESDWNLLTTAKSKDGYFGAAYWNRKMQAVVIAHKGTRLTSLYDLKADYSGILLNQYIPRISSAATFSHKIAVKLKELGKKYSAFLTLSFTGHSLGGWLAQISAFTTQYLTVKIFGSKQIFVKSEEEAYHTHTVVFDSPGCKNMLSKMENDFQTRYNDNHHLISLLDVTIFLSAPNFVNTIHSHLDNGNLYRVFIKDLHEMTSLLYYITYSAETHKMDKIKDVFASEESSTTKETIMKIIDWPLVKEEGLFKLFFNRVMSRNPDEYRQFFQIANCTNNYNPTVDGCKYCKVCYQVKEIKNDGRCSANVFTHAEFQFLVRYRKFYQFPSHLIAEHMFRSLEQNTGVKITKDEVNNILNEFQLEKGKGRGFIVCKSNKHLINLIFLVKNILFLSPFIHKKMREELKNNSNINLYKNQSDEYLRPLESIELKKATMQNLIDFLENTNLQFLQQIFEMHRLLGVKKIHEVLESANSEYKIENTIFLSLEQLIELECSFTLVGFLKTLHEATPVLFVVECDTEPSKAAALFKDLFNVLRNNHKIKFILVSQKCKDLKFCLEDSNSFYCEKKDDSNIKLADLTDNSQNQLLERKVYFQGDETRLDTFITEETKHLIDEEILFKLINNETIAIDEKFLDLGDLESYYIERKFCRHVKIKNLIKEEKSRFFITYSNQIDKSKLKQCQDIVLISDTDNDFNKLCNEHENYRVHWLKEEDNQFEWRKSHGNLSNLRKFIDMDNASEYHDVNGDVVVISSAAGEGNSTVLSRLAQIIKERDNSLWVVKINLKAHASKLESENCFNDQGNIFNVLFSFADLNTPLEKKLLTHYGRIALLLDGFENIAVKDRGKLLKAFKDSKIEKLFITTRPHMKEELEDAFGVLSYSLKPFSENDQETFLSNYWSKTPSCSLRIGECIYAKKLIDSVSQLISDEKKEFTGIPLHTRILAEAFENKYKTFCNSPHQNKVNLPNYMNIVEFFPIFVKRKFEMSFHLARIPGDYKKILFDDFHKKQNLLALYTLFSENDLTQLLSRNKIEETLNYKFQWEEGFISEIVDGKPLFTHISFANYFAARFLSSEKKIKKQKVKHFLRGQIFRKENELFCRFFNYMLTEDKYGCGVHIAVLSNDEDEVKRLLYNTVEDITCATDRAGRTALHLAVAYGDFNITIILLENGFNVNKRDQLLGWSPLNYAEEDGDKKIAEILFQRVPVKGYLWNLTTQIIEYIQRLRMAIRMLLP
nr:uncharacterized protein LOC107441805 [Parasteatoda tepidariorum]XP_042900450.1 uncharacterized protein LOC107441805 [Parasteatoda tepidariorum]XP_042900451.1 uncharacterized protein LOC107441805 [Parasteatoda tepidariorum]XP_042900452.1 uncharacterized protein LOC107441805 [Parasteatoda tepidariorum]XP_042900453.1 uncharacterized protein LOC107441805 [Parasteatoda tepidariorum]